MAYVVTISGVLWGLFIFEEHHSLWIWGALAVMLMGLALVTPRSQESGARNQEPGLPDS
jgi:drug/metabolite transporter (DMT)-like permease